MVHTPKFEAVPQLWEPISRSWTPAAPAQVIRLLTEGAVHAGNTRAVFVGVDAYQTAGGAVLCHLFEQDGGFSLQDAALLDRLVADKLAPQEAARRGWSPPAGAEPAAAELLRVLSYPRRWGHLRSRLGLPLPMRQRPCVADQPSAPPEQAPE